ncbi:MULTISPECIES: MFS transporter [Okeania]|uniref:MFS transporter n=2 Tax=Okeania hirsuta TaxID=1458930 RepID=A0A3N6MNV4_9CYAN|nr:MULTISPECIES: MFS transporter [Okeania]NET14719.1 MFS transporter [Okeania sp. SIO1H6]NEP70738.1 MFS transporter [Okeania sp. SIO2G5]NEP93437.1 MFS transporter [Okeania sp. SIO2F5]NEQ92708.1 MFS transporter [Okeania sp. SIO2G4]NES78403.1 MFS transporter [Okeania sp. SIO1H4]
MQNPIDSQTFKLNRTIRVLGLVSLFTDLASKMVYPLTPVFLTSVLGSPIWTVGVVEGIAESTASILKLYSGWMSDRVGQRKPFAVAGYGLGAVSKLGLALSGVWVHVLTARLIDRVGKGLRAAPRDALIAENCAPERRGQAFGLHHSLETVGEVVGPFLGILCLQQFAGNYRSVFAIALLPALLGIVLLLFLVKEPKPTARTEQLKKRPQFTLRGLNPIYQHYLLVIGLFSLGNSSDAFLLIRAQGLGFSGTQLLLLYALFNLVETCLGLVAGRLSDRVGRRPLLITGYLVFAVVYLGFAVVQQAGAIWGLFALYGLYSTLTRGVQKAFVADLVHPERRGAEIGTFYMLVGLAALPASLIAGWLYAQVSPAAPFYLSAGTAVVAAILLSRIRRSS